MRRLSKFVRRYGLRTTVITVVLMSGFLLFFSFSTALKNGRVIVREGESRNEIASQLEEQGLIGERLAFLALYTIRYGFGVVRPGGYEISEDMSVWEIIRTLRQAPYLRWVVIPEGLRKEEIALILAERLEWSAEKKSDFLKTHETIGKEAREGFFYPDTYLLPISESGEQIARRLINRFHEAVDPFYKEMLKENIKNDTALILASIIQREAAGPEDMPLVSGILWNRLLRGMRLEVDATLQYARGDAGRGYWAPITPKEKDMYSSFNTYRYSGLTPTPISNPGLSAIRSAVYPMKTDCLYYIHDSSRRIHCAKTYTEHKRNIQRYL